MSCRGLSWKKVNVGTWTPGGNGLLAEPILQREIRRLKLETNLQSSMANGICVENVLCSSAYESRVDTTPLYLKSVLLQNHRTAQAIQSATTSVASPSVFATSCSYYVCVLDIRSAIGTIPDCPIHSPDSFPSSNPRKKKKKRHLAYANRPEPIGFHAAIPTATAHSSQRTRSGIAWKWASRNHYCLN